jgi:GH43 family beta-xylosidase
MRGAIEEPVMSGFVTRLESLNALADASPGFVWRYQTDAGDATEVRVFADELILFNMSVWDSIAALENYVYRSNHIEALQKRGEWFERPSRGPLVLWWVKAGHIPSVEEAKERFDILWRDGPGPTAFTFRERFAPPDEHAER